MKKICLLFLCILAGLGAAAAQIAPEQAVQAAEMFVNQKATARGVARAPLARQMSACAVETDGSVMVYAVNLGNDDGFVLVGATDKTDDIIGYSDHGTFDVQKMPANMRAWLESYTASARNAGDNGSQARMRRAAARNSTKTPIAPLLTCHWHQSAPFNDQCPIVNGNRAATGCTMTAFAQVMYYHKWPVAATKAIPGYTPDNRNGTNYPTLPALEPTTFNWDKIYPTYKNKEDGTEVARLFQYIGTAARADYGPETNATGYNMVQALIKYFDYDASAYALWRRQCSYDEWVDKLYAELQANRPVVFSGTAPDAAHSFVVDGYDEEDFFHVNWGWGDNSDGYYRVVLMDPKDQGTGGSDDDSAYTIDQVAFFGVRPNAGQTASPARLKVKQSCLYQYDSATNTQIKVSETTSAYSTGDGYLLWPGMNSHNYSGLTADFDLGSRLVKDDGSVIRDYKWGTANYEPNQGLENHSMPIYLDPINDPTLTDGDYKMYFTSRVKGTEAWLLDEDSDNHYVIIHLDHAHGKLVATLVANMPKLSVKDIKFLNTPTVGENCYVTLTVANNGTAAFHGDVGLCFQFGPDSNQWLAAISCDIEPGATATVNLSFIPKEAGELAFTVDDHMGNTLCKGSVTVVPNTVSDDCELTITRRILNADGNEIVGPKALLELTVTNNSDVTYKGDICVYCLKWVGEENTLAYTEKEETIPARTTVKLQRESPVLTGAEFYSFTTMYMKGDKQIQQDDDDKYYTVAPYCYVYCADGSASTMRLTTNLQPDATVCTVDLTGIEGVMSVDTSANPNMMILVDANSGFTGDNIVKGDQAENVILTDGYPFYCPISFNASHISYTRIPSAYVDVNSNKGWSTLVLPFAATGCQTAIDGVVTPLKWYSNTHLTNADIWIGTYQYENGNEMEFALPEATLTSCHPYLLGVPSTVAGGKSLVGLPITFYADNAEVKCAKASVSGHNYKMMGTLMPVKPTDGIYVLNADGSAFVRGTHLVNPFHDFFFLFGSVSPASMLPIRFLVDSPTGIGEIVDRQVKNSQGIIYNLNGQRVSKPGKGIYIVDGKKVVF